MASRPFEERGRRPCGIRRWRRRAPADVCSHSRRKAGPVKRSQKPRERLVRLEARLRQDSRTSSMPPSSDPPKTRAQRRAEARAKAKGVDAPRGWAAQVWRSTGPWGCGSRVASRGLGYEIVDHYPQACGGCGRGFPAQERRPRRRFGRHQIAELPPISVVWTESHAPAALSALSRADQRPVARRDWRLAFGPRLQAAVVTLTARHRVSRRGICELARDLFGVTLSTGAADAICERASEALAGPHLQLQDWVSTGQGACR